MEKTNKINPKNILVAPLGVDKILFVPYSALKMKEEVKESQKVDLSKKKNKNEKSALSTPTLF